MDSKESHSSGCFGKSAPVVTDDESISASRSHGAGINMESYIQSLHHYKGMMNNSMSPHPQPPPPVAMSLRARESSSMALKQIFEQQINNSGASSREQATQGQQMGGFQGTPNQSMADLRKRLPELDLTFRKAHDNNPPYAQTGFGSPITTPTAASQSLLSQSSLPSWSSLMNGQLMQHNYLPQALASTRPNPSSRQSTAQMTIFYSGNVNVYDDVPLDKAHAIMLLAGNSWSSNFRCPVPPAAPISRPAEMTTMKERAPLPVKPTSSQQSPVALTNTNGGGIARSFSPAPATSAAATTLASAPPSPAPAPLANNIKLPQAGAVAKRLHAGIELPHARKASLARFLEKRKGCRVVQVQVNPDEQEGGVGEKGGGGKGGPESTSCSGGKPTTSASSKKQCMRSRSPSPSRSTSKVNNSATNMIDVDDESNEHRFSQQQFPVLRSPPLRNNYEY